MEVVEGDWGADKLLEGIFLAATRTKLGTLFGFRTWDVEPQREIRAMARRGLAARRPGSDAGPQCGNRGLGCKKSSDSGSRPGLRLTSTTAKLHTWSGQPSHYVHRARGAVSQFLVIHWHLNNWPSVPRVCSRRDGQCPMGELLQHHTALSTPRLYRMQPWTALVNIVRHWHSAGKQTEHAHVFSANSLTHSLLSCYISAAKGAPLAVPHDAMGSSGYEQESQAALLMPSEPKTTRTR